MNNNIYTLNPFCPNQPVTKWNLRREWQYSHSPLISYSLTSFVLATAAGETWRIATCQKHFQNKRPAAVAFLQAYNSIITYCIMRGQWYQISIYTPMLGTATNRPSWDQALPRLRSVEAPAPFAPGIQQTTKSCGAFEARAKIQQSSQEFDSSWL